MSWPMSHGMWEPATNRWEIPDMKEGIITSRGQVRDSFQSTWPHIYRILPNMVRSDGILEPRQIMGPPARDR